MSKKIFSLNSVRFCIIIFFYQYRYLWFFMECILTRGDNHNFMKKLAENIKQTRDANAEETDKVNQVFKLKIF